MTLEIMENFQCPWTLFGDLADIFGVASIFLIYLHCFLNSLKCQLTLPLGVCEIPRQREPCDPGWGQQRQESISQRKLLEDECRQDSSQK